MTTTYQTPFGIVTVGKPYNHFPFGNVVDLKLVKPDNQENGWGISKPIAADTEITTQLLEEFAQEANSRI